MVLLVFFQVFFNYSFFKSFSSNSSMFFLRRTSPIFSKAQYPLCFLNLNLILVLFCSCFCNYHSVKGREPSESVWRRVLFKEFNLLLFYYYCTRAIECHQHINILSSIHFIALPVFYEWV